MKAEEFFTSIALSYQRLLSSSGSSVPCLRDYCRSRHVSYPDFIRWASVSEIASGLLSMERSKRPIQKVTSDESSIDSSFSSNQSEAGVVGEPLLHPLHILSGSSDPPQSIATPSRLRGIRITFPNGVKVSVMEADSQGIYSLLHGGSL